MGIPAFHSWLVSRYPDITSDVAEYDYDNLYLDMTEIVYQVLHPIDGPSPVITDQVFTGISKYVDLVFDIVRPRKLLFMAFDGVAPRAKMNEQRSRRFRAAKDSSDAAAEEDKLRLEFQSQGRRLPAKNFMGVYFSHLVAPGTRFMADMSNYLKNYIDDKLNNDTQWKGIKVILSDANVPGEGEHKIMSFVRLQKNLPGYHEYTTHCVYGSDADLIMLGLATHEQNFCVLRSLVSTATGERNTGDCKERMYQFLNLFVLREYIKMEVTIPYSNLDNNERRIDDFICMCLFLGNDFLPAIPSLHISEGAIDVLLTVYKSEIVGCGEYLTEGGRPDLKSLERFIGLIGGYEDHIFQRRAVEFKAKIDKFIYTDFHLQRTSFSVFQSSQQRDPRYNPRQSPWQQKGVTNKSEIYENKYEMKRMLKELLGKKRDTFSHGYNKLKDDKVKLGEPGWKERYYREKFPATTVEGIDAVRKEVVMKYIEGLCWVMQYYSEGVGSWKWYYPYYYAPFASDLKDFGDCKISFDELGFPFKPFTQMLAISPAGNSQPLPKEYKKLILNHDSAIKDLYPTDFEIDTDGKRYTWEGIVKLPFVDEERLLAEVAKIEDSLTADEKLQNTATSEIVFDSSRVGVGMEMNGCPSSCCITTSDHGRRDILNNQVHHFIY